jgi:UMF1 family MFS transporter
MMLVDIDRGRCDGAALAKTLEELANAHEVEDDDDNLSQATRDDLRGSFTYQRS